MIIADPFSQVDFVTEQQAFDAVASLLPEPMLLVTGSGRIIAANPAAVRTLGHVENELLAKTLYELSTESKEEVTRFISWCSKSRTMILKSLTFLSKAGEVIECQTEGCAYHTRCQDVEQLVLLRCREEDKKNHKHKEFHRIVKQLLKGGVDNKRTDEYRKKLEYLSYHDVLTGLPNRRLFEKRLDYEWKRAQRDKKTLSLILLDIDYFKQFNDTYGHPAGDECLRRVATTIEACCKRSADLPARYGGEEFVILLPDTEEEGAILIAEELRNNVERLNIRHETSGIHDIVTATLGLSLATPSISGSKQMLIAQADKALYFAKHRGRNHIALLSKRKKNNTLQSEALT